MRLEGKQKKLFTKRNILLMSVGIIVAMLIIGSIFLFLTYVNVFQSASLSNPTQEAQNTLNAYINSLNDYNATAAWSLTSPNLQTSYGTLQNFNSTFISPLQATGCHAQIIKNNSAYGTIAYRSLIPIQNSWNINADFEITKHNSSQTNQALTFNLKTYAYSHYQPTDWKIDSTSLFNKT